jgi:hypothetical protein
MTKKEIQVLRRPSIAGQILSALKHRDEKTIVARAREYFGPANELANGEKLNALRLHMGSMRFGKFIGETLPKLGISKTTGYRWAKLASGLPRHFKNPLVRAQLTHAGSGRGIFMIDDKGKVCLTPAVRTALKQLPPEPRDKDGFKARQWTELLLAGAGKARAKARTRLPSGV